MALSTQGTKLYRGKGDTTPGPETFELVTNLQDFSGPTTSRGEIDTTTLDSTAKEYILALKDHGEMTFNGLFAPTDMVQRAITGDLNSNAPRNWKLTFSDGVTTAAFSGYVKGAPISGGVDAAVKYALTIRITGDITWTYPT